MSGVKKRAMLKPGTKTKRYVGPDEQEKFLKAGWYFQRRMASDEKPSSWPSPAASDEKQLDTRKPDPKPRTAATFRVNVVRAPMECIHNKTYVPLMETRELAEPVNMCVLKNECCKDLENFPEWCPLVVVEYVGEIGEEFQEAVKQAVLKKEESLFEKLGKL